MFSEEAAVQFECPLLETDLSGSEMQELLCLIQSEQSFSPNSGSQGSNSNRTVYTIDERKRRRMVSNRESARRCRWRKKRHLENLTDQLNRLKTENRDLSDRLNPVLSRSIMLRAENERLTLESVALIAKLSHLCRLLSSSEHAMYPTNPNQY